MNLSIHFIVSLALAIALYPFFGWLSLFIIAGGFLIDADHYIWCIAATKNFSLMHAYNYHKYHDFRHQLHIFHSIEFIVLMLIAGFYHAAFMLVFLGLIVHCLMDLCEMKYVDKNFNSRYFSIISYIFNRKGVYEAKNTPKLRKFNKT